MKPVTDMYRPATENLEQLSAGEAEPEEPEASEYTEEVPDQGSSATVKSSQRERPSSVPAAR